MLSRFLIHVYFDIFSRILFSHFSGLFLKFCFQHLSLSISFYSSRRTLSETEGYKRRIFMSKFIYVVSLNKIGSRNRGLGQISRRFHTCRQRHCCVNIVYRFVVVDISSSRQLRRRCRRHRRHFLHHRPFFRCIIASLFVKASVRRSVRPSVGATLLARRSHEIDDWK